MPPWGAAGEGAALSAESHPSRHRRRLFIRAPRPANFLSELREARAQGIDVQAQAFRGEGFDALLRERRRGQIDALSGHLPDAPEQNAFRRVRANVRTADRGQVAFGRADDGDGLNLQTLSAKVAQKSA